MLDSRSLSRTITATAIATTALATTARADITGFNNLSGWTYTQAPSDTGTRADLPDPDTIHLTNLGTGQARSIFYNTPQDITRFSTSFTYQALNASTFGCDYGGSLIIQNVRPDIVGGTGGGLGYTGIGDSVAVTLQLTRNASGLWEDGVSGSSPTVSPLRLNSGNPFHVSLEYDGNILSQTLRDMVTMQEVTRNIPLGDLSAILGGDTAYIGFSGSTTTGSCSGHAANQYFSDFQFTTVPAPGAGALMALAGLGGAMRRRR